MRALLWAALPVLFLAGPAWGQPPVDPIPVDPGNPGGVPVDPMAPDATVTDKSTVDGQLKKVKGAAEVVPTGGAVIQSVRIEILNDNGTPVDQGAAAKDAVGNVWRFGSQPIGAGKYKVRTTVTIRDALNPGGRILAAVTSAELTVP